LLEVASLVAKKMRATGDVTFPTSGEPL
jgi:hypothetical protein